MQRLIHIDDFSKGLITFADQGDLPLNSATKFENIRGDMLGKIRGIPGYKLFANGPSGIAGDVRWFEEVVLNDTQVLICWGLDGSSIQHFYYSDDGGSSWVEMTEVHFDTLNGATISPDTSFAITTGNNNIGAGWFVFVEGDTVIDYVLSYAANVVTTKYGVGTFPDGTDVAFTRFPLWNLSHLHSANINSYRNIVQNPTIHKPSEVQRQEGVAIYTSKDLDVDALQSNMRNLWFGHINRSFLNDSDLDYNNYHCENKYLDFPASALVSSLGVTGGSDDPLPAATYSVALSFLYDDYQESSFPIYHDNRNDIPANLTQVVASGEELDVTLSWDRFSTMSIKSAGIPSRRITKIRIWLCQSEVVTSGTLTYEPITPFYFVKDIEIDSTSWSGTGPYTYSLKIYGRDWNAGQRNELEATRGHLSRIWQCGDFGVVVNGREIMASILTYDNEGIASPNTASQETNPAYLVPSAVNSALRNTPDAVPNGDIVNMGEHEIYKILSVKEIANRLAVFGENKLQIMEFIQGNLVPVNDFDGLGVLGEWSTISTGLKLFWGNQQSIYLFTRFGDPIEVGLSIKDTWLSETAANRKTSIAAYDPENRYFVLHSQSGTTYIYNELQQSWQTYVGDKSMEWITTGVDGELLMTDKTDIYQLFPSSGSTENLTGTYEKVIDFGQQVTVKALQLMYKITGLITVKIFDLEKGENYPVAKPVKFFNKTNFEAVTKRVTFKAKKIKLQLTFAPTAASNHDYELNWISLYGHQHTENR